MNMNASPPEIFKRTHDLLLLIGYAMGPNWVVNAGEWVLQQTQMVPGHMIPNFFRQWRHLKRGSTYVEVERVPFQRSTIRTPVDGDTVVFYRCIETGKAYARMDYEFEDGRFEEIK